MPQLDFFTLLFQFKSFILFFFLIYFFFLFFFVPKLHLIISTRRLQLFKLLSYHNSLKLIIYKDFYSQCFFLKTNILYYSFLFETFFTKFLQSMFSIPSFLWISFDY